MKTTFKALLYILFVILIGLNIWIFARGIYLSKDISEFELKTRELKKENMELEAQLYTISSLKYTSSMAASLDFSKKAEPYFLDNLKVALKK